MVTVAATPIHAVDRPALRRQLNEALVQPLTLVVAPAGSGKSVLLTQWAATHPEVDFVWLDLTPSDDDPVRFAQRLLQGLTAVDPEAAELGQLVSLHGGGLGTPLLEALAGFLAELPETVLVLDDLHQLTNATLLADLGRFVELAPANVHLVLSTRVDPPIAWSRHRLRRGLTEIRQAELAFDDADSARLLERITGRPLGTDQVAALVNRTEGWATGLQLAAMMLRLHEDADRFITQFSGSDRLIADYLSEEVLEAQPSSRRAFLLQSSVLDEMCADLVSHLTGVPDAQLVLEALERESMFLVPLDGRREWYRFHHLFRDLLRFRLRAEDPGAERRLLELAAVVVPGTGGGRPGRRVPAAGPQLGARPRPHHVPGQRDLRAGSDGHGDPLDQPDPRDRPGREERREPPPRLAQGGRRAGRRGRGHRAPGGRRPRGVAGRAGVCPVVPGRHGPVAS